MEFHISLAGKGDLSARIYQQLLDAIVDGRLRNAERLPATRELAQRLQVARNTVSAAYDRLKAEGFLVSKAGSGTFVRAEAIARAKPRTAPAGDVKPRAFWASMPTPLPKDPVVPYHFGTGIGQTSLFPLHTWRRLVNRELREATVQLANFGEAAGHPGLRTAISRYFGVARSVRSSAADILVTQGAQQALDLIGRVLIDPGSTVAVEDPGYPPARQLFMSLGARVVGVPVDADGLQVAALPDDARLVYVTPSHQFPIGTTMSLRRRTQLLDWARCRDAIIVEDDYDSEFRYADRPLEPMQSLDRDGRVIYVGTFSKTLLPMLRIGFMVAPASLRPALLAARQLSDHYGVYSDQAALARFIDEGLLAAQVRKSTKVYAERYRIITAAVQRELSPWLDLMPAIAGLHVCALRRADCRLDIDEVARRAGAAGVLVRPVSFYASTATVRQGLVLGYGLIPAERIDRGIQRIAGSFRQQEASQDNRARRTGIRTATAFESR
jgi:GntR family transcriptional regulator/MocR family aminotransferase